MFERFTETAIQVILLAQEESRLLEDNLAKPNEVIINNSPSISTNRQTLFDKHLEFNQSLISTLPKVPHGYIF